MPSFFYKYVFELNFSSRHLRLAELLRLHSSDSEMIVMTLPLPRRGQTSEGKIFYIPVRTQKNETTNSPIHEFKVLQDVF